MDDAEVGAHWDFNAPAWIDLSRAGYDLWRDLVNTPAFVALLPPVHGLRGLDIGCGEGANTRTVARLGATLSGIDISAAFVSAAAAEERRDPLGITYSVARAQELPFADETFDFATAFMSLMDVADYAGALREAYRVLRPRAFFQFSILHPCFTTAERTIVSDEAGDPVAVQNARYFEPVEYIEEWTFGAAPANELARWPKFRVPYFGRTLSEYVNGLIDAGLTIERIAEPYPDAELVAQHPRLAAMTIVATLLQVRARKGGAPVVERATMPAP